MPCPARSGRAGVDVVIRRREDPFSHGAAKVTQPPSECGDGRPFCDKLTTHKPAAAPTSPSATPSPALPAAARACVAEELAVKGLLPGSLVPCLRRRPAAVDAGAGGGGGRLGDVVVRHELGLGGQGAEV